MKLTADILLVTATEVETKAVLEIARQQTQQLWTRRPLVGNIYYDLGVVGGAKLFLVQSAIGASSLGATAQTVQQGIDALKPIAVIMVGIAFGTEPDTQQIGDVLLAHHILLYEPQKVASDPAGQPRILPRGTRADVSPWLLKAFRSGSLDWSLGVQTTQATRPPQVQVGLILSGEKLIDNLTLRNQLRQIEPEAIGGEMEGAGLYIAAHQGRVDWILVKAICDWADGNKADNKQHYQQQAAHNAAHFVFHVIQQGTITRATAPNLPPIIIRPEFRIPVILLDLFGIGAFLFFIKGQIDSAIAALKIPQQLDFYFLFFWAFTSAFIGGFLWNSLNIISRKYQIKKLDVFLGGDLEPHGIAAIIWAVITNLPTVIILFFLNLQYHFADILQQILLYTVFLSGLSIGSYYFYDSPIHGYTGFREYYKTKTMSFFQREFILVGIWSLSLAFLGFLLLDVTSLLITPKVTPPQSILVLFLKQITLCVGITTLSVSFFLLALPNEPKFETARGIVAGLFLRIALFFGLLFA